MTTIEALGRTLTRRQMLQLGLIGLPISVACVQSTQSVETPEQQLPKPLPTVRPDILMPRTVISGRANVLLYKQGAIVNATTGIDLAVLTDNNLPGINIDPAFGINLSQDEQNVTYLFPQSFAADNQRQTAIRQVEEELPLVLSALNKRFGIDRGRVRFSVISVADALSNVIRRNPGLNPTNTELINTALSIELAHAYLGLTGARIFDINDTPRNYPELSASLRIRLAESRAYPFSVVYINPRYLTALNLLKPGVRF